MSKILRGYILKFGGISFLEIARLKCAHYYPHTNFTNKNTNFTNLDVDGTFFKARNTLRQHLNS
jgi:hypothetical protein